MSISSIILRKKKEKEKLPIFIPSLRRFRPSKYHVFQGFLLSNLRQFLSIFLGTLDEKKMQRALQPAYFLLFHETSLLMDTQNVVSIESLRLVGSVLSSWETSRGGTSHGGGVEDRPAGLKGRRGRKRGYLYLLHKMCLPWLGKARNALAFKQKNSL